MGEIVGCSFFKCRCKPCETLIKAMNRKGLDSTVSKWMSQLLSTRLTEAPPLLWGLSTPSKDGAKSWDKILPKLPCYILHGKEKPILIPS